MENNIDEIQEVELKEASEEEMGPEERTEEFGVPTEDVELDEFDEEEIDNEEEEE